MALKNREVEMVVTETGFCVHSYWPHAHRTACGLRDDQTFPIVLEDGEVFMPCSRCARFLPSAGSHTEDSA